MLRLKLQNNLDSQTHWKPPGVYVRCVVLSSNRAHTKTTDHAVHTTPLLISLPVLIRRLPWLSLSLSGIYSSDGAFIEQRHSLQKRNRNRTFSVYLCPAEILLFCISTFVQKRMQLYWSVLLDGLCRYCTKATTAIDVCYVFRALLCFNSGYQVSCVAIPKLKTVGDFVQNKCEGNIFTKQTGTVLASVSHFSFSGRILG